MKKDVKVEKSYYTVEIDCTIPAVIRFKVLAESPEVAANIAVRSGIPQEPPKLNLSKLKAIKSRVYRLLSRTLLFSK